MRKPRKNIPTETRLYKYIEKTETCWLWTGAMDKDGYGLFSTYWPKKQNRVHRYLFELFNGPVPDHMNVLHKCDVRRCCNPDHLFLGTHLDNIKDMDKKHRRVNASQKGSANGESKLTEDQVIKIRNEYPTTGETMKEIGARYGVTKSNIAQIVYRTSWKHI